VRLAAVPGERPFELSRISSSVCPGRTVAARRAAPRSASRRGGANRGDFTCILNAPALLDQLSCRFPCHAAPGRSKTVRVPHTQRMRLETDHAERPERRQTPQQPVPHTRPLNLDARDCATLLPRLLVVAEIGDEEDLARVTTATPADPLNPQIADVGRDGHE